MYLLSQKIRRVRAGNSLRNLLLQWSSGLLLACLSPVSMAELHPLPPQGVDLIGALWTVEAQYEDTLIDIARLNSTGQDEIMLANPDVDRWMPGAGTPIIIPSYYILPATPRDGLVLNLAEMRMYYYPPVRAGQNAEVWTYPVGVGRMEWETPLGETRIVDKTKDPGWTPPESIRREHAADGDPLPRYVPPGPDNPLGRYAMRLGIPGYLIHSTNKSFGVGMRVSHGCVRMLPEDIEELFAAIPIGSKVRIINQPVKVGWKGEELYVEIHPTMEEEENPQAVAWATFDLVGEAIADRAMDIDGVVLRAAIDRRDGLPTKISK